MSVSVKIGEATKYADERTPITIKHKDNQATSYDNIEISFWGNGWYTYNGFAAVCKIDHTTILPVVKTLPVAGLMLDTDIVVHAGIYNADYPFPPEISTPDEMDKILSEATDDFVGAIYKYTGENTSIYENGAVYTLVEE